MKPWQLGDGDNTVSTEQLRMEFIFDSINRQLQSIGVTDQTTFDVFANYIGYSTGGTPSYQDMQVAWTPTIVALPNAQWINIYGLNLGLTTYAFSGTACQVVDIEDESVLTSALFPNLATCGGAFIFKNLPLLTTLSAPLLTTVASGDVEIIGTGLTTVSLPSLTTIFDLAHAASSGLDLEGSITSVSIPNYVPFNGAYIFVDAPLDATSVNQILAVHVANAGYVTGDIEMNANGACAAPTGQGIADKATLIGRGVTVLTN